jgi:hypothetical protein
MPPREPRDRAAARRARNLVLTCWIDHLIRIEEVEDLASVARTCGVSRARLSEVVGLIEMAVGEQERLLGSACLTR